MSSVGALTWDEIGSKYYETGVDRGVLYLPDSCGVPWSGLTAIIEKNEKDLDSVYFDGMKVSDLVSIGSFSATMKAITYPDEFLLCEGYDSPVSGLLLGDQKVKTFSLSYRTLVGNDLDGEVGYKIHILYNLMVIPSNKEYSTVSDDPSMTEFEWEITAIPSEVPGYRPTAHVVVDSRKFDANILAELENILYGTEEVCAKLIPTNELVQFLTDWFRIKITDNGDGTWTALTNEVGLIELGATFMVPVVINEATISVLDADSYIISDTVRTTVTPGMVFVDNEDGTWTATIDNDSLLTLNIDDTFELREVNAVYVNPYTYRVATGP